ncbi:MAG: hemolysin secretion protein [Rhodospirillales bacterium]|nr:hemolysin secretion protein [Rhodospirillales bacterium]
MADPQILRRDLPAETTPAAPAETAAPAPVAAQQPAPRRRRVRLVLFALLPVVLIVGLYAYAVGGTVMSTENAYVRADMVALSTDVSGIVAAIPVHDNQPVAAGDVLFRLDDLPFRLALQRAEAQVGTVRNDIEALKASYRDMQAQIAQAQIDVAFFGREVTRQQQLIARNFTAQVTLDQAQRNLQNARQKVASLNQQLAGIVANLSGNPDIASEQHPRYLEAVAQRDEAARQLAHTVVRAPVAGIVTNVPSLQPGQYLAAATPAFSIVSSDHVWIEANPKETELTYVRVGQQVDVTVDTYPDDSWTGTVDSVSPASAASFSLLPAQNSSGNWVKVVQRIPMRVRLETPAGKPPLRAGMSVIVRVQTGHSRGLPFVGNDAPPVTPMAAVPAPAPAHG